MNHLDAYFARKRLLLNLGMHTIKNITFLLLNNSINNSYY